MRIVKTWLERHDLELREPYTIAYETVTATTNFVLWAETDRGLLGRGCAAPDKVITGEDAEDVAASYARAIEPALLGADPFYYTRILDELKLAGIGAAARAMVDMLLFDLVAKEAGVPLYHYLGAYRDALPTSVTIGILPYAETLVKAGEWVEAGFSFLKIKGGLDWEEDLRKIAALRSKYPGLGLRFDGNQGYTLEDALRFARQAEQYQLEILEQPLLVGEEQAYAQLSGTTAQPIMADESIKTLRDSFHLAKHGMVDMINIKLMKVGGIQEGLHINSVSRAAGFEVMVGCLDECQLGIAAGLHFALSRPNVEFADLDSFLDLDDDPTAGMFHLQDGVLYPNQEPGLG